MRTTLTKDDDVLQAAKALARVQRRSTGEVISDWARRSMYKAWEDKKRHQIPLLTVPRPGVVVTLDLVNQFRDEQL